MSQELQLLASQRSNNSQHHSPETPRMLAIIGNGSEITTESDSRIYVSAPTQEDPDELNFKLHLKLGHIGVPLYSEGLESSNSRYKQLAIGKAAFRMITTPYHNSPWSDDEPSIAIDYYWLPDLANLGQRISMLSWEVHERSINLRNETLVIEVNNEAARKLQF